MALGIAEGALGEITTLASAKVPMLASSTLAANPLFRYRLGEADALLRAAPRPARRRGLPRRGRRRWPARSSPRSSGPGSGARRSGSTGAAAQVVDAAYTAGGGSAFYSSSPLQRRLRDVHAVTQHFAVKADTLTTVGAVLAGQDVDVTFL